MARILTNSSACKGYRIRAGIDRREMCRMLEIGTTRYHNLENALVNFRPQEMLMYARVCHLSLKEFNEVFFGGELPNE